jgi:hypothetical protein
MDLDRLSALALPAAGGGAVRLGDLWRERPCVLVFLRHFG